MVPDGRLAGDQVGAWRGLGTSPWSDPSPAPLLGWPSHESRPQRAEEGEGGVTWMAASSDRNKEDKECFLSSQRGGDSTDYQMADRSMTPTDGWHVMSNHRASKPGSLELLRYCTLFQVKCNSSKKWSVTKVRRFVTMRRVGDRVRRIASATKTSRSHLSARSSVLPCACCRHRLCVS
jgi:hypothetical protein